MINSKGPLVCCVEGVEQVVQVVLCQPIRGQYYQNQPTRGQYYQHQPIRGQYYLSTKSPTPAAPHRQNREGSPLQSYVSHLCWIFWEETNLVYLHSI